MKTNQFDGCKTLALIIFCLISLIYYHNTSKTCVLLYRQLNGTDSIAAVKESTKNEGTTVNRIKRFLVFQGGGVVKLVLGTSFPIKTADNKRSLNYFYNFQMQYPPPTIPLYWWSIYNTSTFAARKRSLDKLVHFDNSRNYVYELIKTALAGDGSSASDCLLNVICQLARTPFAEDFNRREEPTLQNSKDDGQNEIEDDCGRNIYHSLFNAIFTFDYSNVKEPYLNAQIAGKSGANCDKTFGKCAIAEKFLKSYTHII